MFFLFRPKTHAMMERGVQSARTGMLSFALLCLLFGLAIFAAPELLAYLVGGFFVVTGISLLLTWWNLK